MDRDTCVLLAFIAGVLVYLDDNKVTRLSLTVAVVSGIVTIGQRHSWNKSTRRHRDRTIELDAHQQLAQKTKEFWQHIYKAAAELAAAESSFKGLPSDVSSAREQNGDLQRLVRDAHNAKQLCHKLLSCLEREADHTGEGRADGADEWPANGAEANPMGVVPPDSEEGKGPAPG